MNDVNVMYDVYLIPRIYSKGKWLHSWDGLWRRLKTKGKWEKRSCQTLGLATGVGAGIDTGVRLSRRWLSPGERRQHIFRLPLLSEYNNPMFPKPEVSSR